MSGLRARVGRLERKATGRPDRWAKWGGQRFRLIVSLDASYALPRAFLDVLEAIPEDGPHADAVEQVLAGRWPALTDWLGQLAGALKDTAAAGDLLAEVPDPALAAVAEAREVPRPTMAILDGADAVERDAAAFAYWLATFARALVFGVGARHDHPAYAKTA